jgi:hypothetical protein
MNDKVKKLTMIKNKIESIDEIDHLQIFTCINNYYKENNMKLKYTTNRNGVFMNMSSFDDKLIEKLEHTIVELEEYNNKRTEYSSMMTNQEMV